MVYIFDQAIQQSPSPPCLTTNHKQTSSTGTPRTSTSAVPITKKSIVTTWFTRGPQTRVPHCMRGADYICRFPVDDNGHRAYEIDKRRGRFIDICAFTDAASSRPADLDSVEEIENERNT
ncbi:uncharacterized protein BO80DRAFT_447718 [Aspergillus ibericus CBS 121593]|uniref:Uncharacterized protein n=1 Tax=Aspergillus ibericus CBS 121593 TaxID=1448316 RepID=A0A395GTV7_9EURO|nr:hypothetical protein BO80DRAFT_447718 [Aspergillus ibericus CBS 121593]RAK98107.1 hypothetical protein BO80DRAFT_447718 [Aspergillus ibericus CBS 121593]